MRTTLIDVSGLILVPLADKPAMGRKPLQWSLDLWGTGNPWFSAEDWRSFYDRGALADYSRWDGARVDQELIYLALESEEVVGVIALVDFDDVEEFRHLKPWVAAFVVDPARRGTGIGSQMLTALEERARNFGIQRLYLWTQDEREFYQNRGYEFLHHRDYPEISLDVLGKDLI